VTRNFCILKFVADTYTHTQNFIPIPFGFLPYAWICELAHSLQWDIMFSFCSSMESVLLSVLMSWQSCPVPTSQGEPRTLAVGHDILHADKSIYLIICAIIDYVVCRRSSPFSCTGRASPLLLQGIKWLQGVFIALSFCRRCLSRVWLV